MFARGRAHVLCLLWPLLVQLEGLFGVTVGHGFNEVGVQRPAMWAWYHVAVVAEEIQALLWM